jgi:methyl-accepting chemotaxis protein
VEAARAGESGLGFAVVAQEVRNLAQRCAEAAHETSQKIEDSILKSAQGVQISVKVCENLRQMVAKTRQVDDLVAQIAEASKEQDHGITQVNNAMINMGRITQEASNSAQETSDFAKELNRQASALNHSISGLLQMVSGKETSARTTPASTPSPLAGKAKSKAPASPKPSLALVARPRR